MVGFNLNPSPVIGITELGGKTSSAPLSNSAAILVLGRKVPPSAPMVADLLPPSETSTSDSPAPVFPGCCEASQLARVSTSAGRSKEDTSASNTLASVTSLRIIALVDILERFLRCSSDNFSMLTGSAMANTM